MLHGLSVPWGGTYDRFLGIGLSSPRCRSGLGICLLVLQSQSLSVLVVGYQLIQVETPTYADFPLRDSF